MMDHNKLKVKLPGGAVFGVSEILENDFTVNLYRSVEATSENIDKVKNIQPTLEFFKTVNRKLKRV